MNEWRKFKKGKWEKEILEKIDGVSYCNVDIIKKSFEAMGFDKPIDNNDDL